MVIGIRRPHLGVVVVAFGFARELRKTPRVRIGIRKDQARAVLRSRTIAGRADVINVAWPNAERVFGIADEAVSGHNDRARRDVPNLNADLCVGPQKVLCHGSTVDCYGRSRSGRAEVSSEDREINPVIMLPSRVWPRSDVGVVNEWCRRCWSQSCRRCSDT